uniref:WSC domain-containing protein n=1 Tax=Macrostomum lignano TaxID=282301 RepID=A0A1I8JAP2_9PLAT
NVPVNSAAQLHPLPSNFPAQQRAHWLVAVDTGGVGSAVADATPVFGRRQLAKTWPIGRVLVGVPDDQQVQRSHQHVFRFRSGQAVPGLQQGGAQRRQRLRHQPMPRAEAALANNGAAAVAGLGAELVVPAIGDHYAPFTQYPSHLHFRMSRIGQHLSQLEEGVSNQRVVEAVPSRYAAAAAPAESNSLKVASRLLDLTAPEGQLAESNQQPALVATRSVRLAACSVSPGVSFLELASASASSSDSLCRSESHSAMAKRRFSSALAVNKMSWNQPERTSSAKNCASMTSKKICAFNLSLLLLSLAGAARVAKLVYIGCYADSHYQQDLDGLVGIEELGKYMVHSTYGYAMANSGMTVELCGSICSLGGFPYCGLQQGGCYCGTSYGRHGRRNESECNWACEGNPLQICGAHGINSVYYVNYTNRCSRFRSSTRSILFTSSNYNRPTYWIATAGSLINCAHRCNSSCQGFIYSPRHDLCRLLSFALVPSEVSIEEGLFFTRVDFFTGRSLRDELPASDSVALFTMIMGTSESWSPFKDVRVCEPIFVYHNDTCQAEELSVAACDLCHDVVQTWRTYQFHLYQSAAGLSLLTNFITILVMLRRKISYACHLHTIVMALADATHATCAAVITRLIMSGGFVNGDSGASCLCKLLYFVYFLSKALSNWTMLTLSVSLWLSLTQPFRVSRVQGTKFGALLTLIQLMVLLAALSPRLVYVEAPTSTTDRMNFLCSLRRTAVGFRCFAIIETFGIALVLPVGANLTICLVNVCKLSSRRGSRFGNRSIRRAVLATGVAHAVLHTPYACSLASMQLGLLDRASGSYYLAICLYYAATTWYSLNCISNFLAYVAFYQVLLLTAPEAAAIVIIKPSPSSLPLLLSLLATSAAEATAAVASSAGGRLSYPDRTHDSLPCTCLLGIAENLHQLLKLRGPIEVINSLGVVALLQEMVAQQRVEFVPQTGSSRQSAGLAAGLHSRGSHAAEENMLYNFCKVHMNKFIATIDQLKSAGCGIEEPVPVEQGHLSLRARKQRLSQRAAGRQRTFNKGLPEVVARCLAEIGTKVGHHLGACVSRSTEPIDLHVGTARQAGAGEVGAQRAGHDSAAGRQAGWQPGEPLHLPIMEYFSSPIREHLAFSSPIMEYLALSSPIMEYLALSSPIMEYLALSSPIMRLLTQPSGFSGRSAIGGSVGSSDGLRLGVVAQPVGEQLSSSAVLLQMRLGHNLAVIAAYKRIQRVVGYRRICSVVLFAVGNESVDVGDAAREVGVNLQSLQPQLLLDALIPFHGVKQRHARYEPVLRSLFQTGFQPLVLLLRRVTRRRANKAGQRLSPVLLPEVRKRASARHPATAKAEAEASAHHEWAEEGLPIGILVFVFHFRWRRHVQAMCESAFAAFGGGGGISSPECAGATGGPQQQQHWRLGFLENAAGRSGSDISGPNSALTGVAMNLMLDSTAQELAFDEDFMQPFEPLAYKSASQHSANGQPIDMLLDMSQSDSCLLLQQQQKQQQQQQQQQQKQQQSAQDRQAYCSDEAMALATTPTPPLTAASQDGGYSADDSESGVGVGGVCQRLLAASPPSTRERYRLVVGLEASGTASELGKNKTGVAIATRGAATATESGANTTTWRRLKSSAGNRLASWRALSEIARVPPTMATSLRLDSNKDFCLDKDCTEEAANVVSPWSERAQYSGTLLELFQRSRRRNSSRDGSHGSLLSVAAAAAAAATAAASSSASSTPADRQSVACQFPPAAGLSAHLRRQRAGGGPLPSGLGFLGDPLPPPPPPPPPPGDTSDSGIDTPGAAAASSSCSTVVCRKCGCRQRPLKSCLLGGGGGGNVGGAGDEADVDSSSSSSSESVIDADIAAAAAAADNDAAAAAADDGAGSNGGFRAKKSVGLYGGDSDSPPLLFHGSPPESPRAVGEKSHRQRLQTLVSDAIRGVNDLLLAIASGGDPQSAAARRLCPPLHGLLTDELLAPGSGGAASSTSSAASPAAPSSAVTASSRLGFGVVKNRSHLWQMIEESCKPGPYNTLFSEALRSVRSISGLSLERLKFNAFVMACLNTRILLSWLVELARNEALLKRYYRQTAFIRGCHNRYCELFADLTTALELLLSHAFAFDLTCPGGGETATGITTTSTTNTTVSSANAPNVSLTRQRSSELPPQPPPPPLPVRRQQMISADRQAACSQQALKVTRVAGLRPPPPPPP